MKKNFYNGLRFHRAEPNFVIQVGDPRVARHSRQATGGAAQAQRQADRRRGDHEEAPARARRRGDGASGHGSQVPPTASSSSLRRAAPELDGKYTVFGKVLKGMDVVAKIQRGDVLKRAYLKE